MSYETVLAGLALKDDEREFMRFILENDGRVPFGFWSQLTKRQYYLLEKWSDKGFWDYGVSARGGWITEEGRKHFAINSSEKDDVNGG